MHLLHTKLLSFSAIFAGTERDCVTRYMADQARNNFCEADDWGRRRNACVACYSLFAGNPLPVIDIADLPISSSLILTTPCFGKASPPLEEG